MLTETTHLAGKTLINYAKSPSNERPIVFLHGVTNRWQTWLPVLPLMAWRYQCFAVDLRGHGRSAHASDGYQCEKFAEDILAFIQHVVKTPVVLVGHSLGAMVSIKVASCAPDLIDALVLEDPPLGAARDFDGPVPSWFQDYLALLNSPGSRREKLAVLTELSPGVDPAAIHAHMKSLEKLDQEVLKQGSRGQMFCNFIMSETLQSIECPILLIRGNPELGGVISGRVMDECVTKMRNVSLMFRADIGHNLHSRNPQEFAAIATDFVEGLS